MDVQVLAIEFQNGHASFTMALSATQVGDAPVMEITTVTIPLDLVPEDLGLQTFYEAAQDAGRRLYFAKQLGQYGGHPSTDLEDGNNDSMEVA